jgi:N-acetylglucosaminyl-diphospho-decaprenol L-rhamnosyltransferase
LIPTSSKGPEGVAQRPLVHAVVLTWNGAHLIRDCLAALRAQDADAELRIVVADNASTDATAALLAREFPDVEHLRLAENFGYGRGNNAAMRRALDAGADYVALVNNDVEVAPDWLRVLLEAARARPAPGLFAGTQLIRDQDVV